MKVRPFPVENTNPFADAAGGAVDPSKSTADGAVGVVATEWDKAVQAVSGQAGQGPGAKHAGGQEQSGGPAQTGLTPVPPLADISSQAAPMGAQWDRLSMTVASLVAWNLTNEIAPDAVEDLTAFATVQETPIPDGIDTDAAQIMPDDTVHAVDAALDAHATSIRAAAPQVDTAPVDAGLINTHDAARMTRAEAISARIAGQAGTLNQEDNAFREGKMLAPDGVRQVSTSTESEPPTARADGLARAGTMADTTAHNPSYGPMARLDPEIPSSLAQAAVQVDESAPRPGIAKSATPMAQVLAGVPKASAQSLAHQLSQGEGAVAQVQAQAQAPTPANAAEMVRDVGLQASLTSAAEGEMRNLRQRVPESAMKSASQHDPVVQQASQDVVLRTLRHRAASANYGQNLSTTTTSSPAPSAEPAAPQVAGAPSLAPDQPSLPDTLARLQRSSTQFTTTLRSEPQAGSELMGATVDGVAAPGAVAMPVSDLEADFTMTNSVLDAETIGAEEVPELPLADTQQFDIDIDDPGGRVRLDLTRQAEEIAIRLETPEEILEEYRDLEKDIEDALEDAGMSLADYEATADGDPQERSDRESQERTSSGSQGRESGTEEAPKRGRLLNRIV